MCHRYDISGCSAASKDRPGMSHGASQGQYQSGLHAAAAKLEAAVSAKQVPDAAPRGVAAAAVGAAALQAAAAAQQKVEPAARGEADDGSMGGATGATEAAPGGVAFNDGQGEMASSSLDGECEELLASTPKGASESDCRSEPVSQLQLGLVYHLATAVRCWFVMIAQSHVVPHSDTPSACCSKLQSSYDLPCACTFWCVSSDTVFTTITKTKQ